MAAYFIMWFPIPSCHSLSFNRHLEWIKQQYKQIWISLVTRSYYWHLQMLLNINERYYVRIAAKWCNNSPIFFCFNFRNRTWHRLRRSDGWKSDSHSITTCTRQRKVGLPKNVAGWRGKPLFQKTWQVEE